MPAGRSHVSFAELQRATRLDAPLLWALLHQTASTLRNLLDKDRSTWEEGPSLLLTPDSILLYSSGSVLFCKGAPDDVTSDFSSPELAIASAPWAKVAVEKTYLYSLGRTLLQGLHSTEEQEGCGPLLSLLSELTATSPFGRPPLTQVLHACELHMRSLEPQVVLGRAVRRAAGHSSTESLVSISSSQLSSAGCVSKSSLAVVGSKGVLRSLSEDMHSRFAALPGSEWMAAENLPMQRGRVLPTPPQGCPLRRCVSFHNYGSQRAGPNLTVAASMLHTPPRPLFLPRPLSISASHDPLPQPSSRTIPRRGSLSTERVNSLFSSRKRRSSGDFLVGSEAAAMFAVYSPQQEDIEATGREQEWEGLREGLHAASEGRTTPVQVEQSDGPPAESQEDQCTTAMGEGLSPTTKQAQELKVHFVVEPDTKEHRPLPEPSPPESGKPECWLMSPEETSASGGTAYTLSYHCSTPPLPQAPPPLFTPYKPDALGPSCDETTLDHSTSALEQNRDSWQEDEVDLAAPPLPLSSPPTLTPTKDVPSCLMDGLEPRMGTDLSTVLEEALQDLRQPPDELPTSKEEPLVVAAPPTGRQSSEADTLDSGTYSEVFEGTGRAVVGRPKWAVSPTSAAPADGDYAVPMDSLDHKRESFDTPEGYVAYATVDGATKRTHHVTVKTIDRSLPRPVEAAGGDRPVSSLSEESLYATVRPPYVDQAATVQPYSDGAPVVDSTRSKQDKLGWILGPDFSRLHRSTSVILPDKTLPALGRGRRVVTVILLNECRMEVMVERDSLCREVHSQVVAALTLEEPYLYGLAVTRGSEEYFLELQKKLSKYAPKAWSKMEAPPPGARAPHEQPPEFIVKFRVQYYLDRDMFKKVSHSARLQLYLQLRRDFLCARLCPPVGVSVRLGAMLGVVEGVGLRECLPSWLIGEGSSGLLQQQVEAVQDTLASLTREEVQAEFLKEASTLEDYGKIFYALAKDKGSPLGDYFMGFGTDGVTVHSFSGNERVVLSKFSWRQLDRIFFENHKVVFSPHGGHPRAYYAGSYKRAHYLWNLSVLLHRFSLYTRSCQTRRGVALDQPSVDKEVRLVKLLKRPGQGIGARLGSSGQGVFVKQVHKNAPADMDGELGPGDRVLSVNGQRVWHHRQASELIRSGPVVVSLLVEKADRDRLPDLSELETSMDGAELSGWLATSMMEDTIPEEADEGGEEVAPQPLRYTLSATTPPESHPIPWEGATQTVVVDWSPEASPPVQEMEGVTEREEGEENGSSEQAQEDKAEAEGVDSSPVESTVTITRHSQKNTFGIKFEVRGRDVRVRSIEPGCPTALGGELQVGSTVLSVGGTPVRGRSLMQVMEMLGHCGTCVDLVVGGDCTHLRGGGVEAD